jgi:L-alanine-DL-glutamate epimerase-like enolase superfamily enzyme
MSITVSSAELRHGAVEAAEAIHVRIPFRRPVATAAGLWTECDSWIVRQRRADGSVSFGEGRTPESAAVFEWPSSVAGRSVAVNAFLGAGPLDEIVAQAGAAVAAGFETLKMKVGTERSTAELAARVGAVRAAIGPNTRLRLDANGAWDADDAPGNLRAVAEHGIEFVEQPITAGSGVAAGSGAVAEPAATAAFAEALATLRAESPVAIAADESVTSVEAARALIEARAADVLVVKPARVGGPDAAVAIASLASAAGIAVVISTFFETGVGIAVALAVAATLPVGPAHGLATADLLESDLLVRPIAIARGRMIVPAGIELNETALDRYAVERSGRWT